MPIIDSLSSLPPEKGNEVPKGRPTWNRRMPLPSLNHVNQEWKDRSVRSVIKSLSHREDVKTDSDKS